MRIVSGCCHYLRTECIGLRLIFTAVLCHPGLCTQHAGLRSGLSAHDRTAEDQENAAEYGNFLIIGLSEAGEYQRAAAWSASTDEANIDWLTQAYDRWALAKPEAALLHAVALTDPTKRRAASDAAIGAWAKTEPKALAECAVNFPPGQEKNLAIVTGLRAWAATEPEKVSEWMIAHRDAIASVPNLATINED